MSILKICKRIASRFYHHELSWKELAFCTSVRFSQFGEDVFLDQYFYGQTDGFYVDVGAYHPFTFSNTYLFYRRGWHGINIEPNPTGFAEFKKHRPRDISLNCAISRSEGECQFTCDGVFSGIQDATHLFHNRSSQAQHISVRTQTLKHILTTHVPDDVRIDFMSVDCEGHDWEVLESNDWERFRPRVLLVEDHEQRAGLSLNDRLCDWNYRYLCTMRITKIFVANDDNRERKV